MWTVALALSLNLACDSTVRSDPTPEAPPPKPASTPETRGDMARHFQEAEAGRLAVVRGDFEAARAAFVDLAEHPEPGGLPVGSEPLLAGFHGAAKQGAAAPDLRGQAVAVAAVARSCGGCHAKVGAQPTFSVPDAPPRDPGVRSHMARHQWAMDRMWEGLVGPREAAWSQAAAMLNDEPVTEAELPKGHTLSEASLASAQRLHGLGAEALAAKDDDARAGHFAEALVACGSCHSEGGVSW